MSSKRIIFAPDFAPIRNFAPLLAQDPAAVYGDTAAFLAGGDLNIVNLESPLCGEGEYIAKSGAAFTGSPEHIPALKAGNFHAAVLANNHTFDRGYDGFSLTRDLLRQNGITPVGAGDDLAEARRPLTVELDGIRIALFTISEGEDMQGATPDSPGVRPWEPERLADDIRQAKQDFDIILVSSHCGLEYQPYPSFYVYEAFEMWAAAGADMIIGHHPHVPQGMSCFGNTPAYFSLGNFIFYQPVKLLHRKTGYLLEMEVAKSGIISHRPVPYRIGDGGVELLKGKALQDFEELFRELSRPLASREGAKAAWHAVLAANGISGFKDELSNILRTMEADPVKGAAMLRNRVSCIQHRSQWLDGMTRIIAETIGDAPAELTAVVRRFMTEETGA